jgi:hypothetical protein
VNEATATRLRAAIIDAANTATLTYLKERNLPLSLGKNRALAAATAEKVNTAVKQCWPKTLQMWRDAKHQQAAEILINAVQRAAAEAIRLWLLKKPIH